MIGFLKNKVFTIVAIAIATLFWFFDASVHYFVYGEPEFQTFPDDINELWSFTPPHTVYLYQKL